MSDQKGDGKPARNSLGQFASGASGNPKGRPSHSDPEMLPEILSDYDQMLLSVLAQPISNVDGTTITLGGGVLRRTAIDAAKGGGTDDAGRTDPRARGKGDARYAQLILSEWRRTAGKAAALNMFLARKFLKLKHDGERELERCRKLSRPAPNLLPHPAHIVVSDDLHVSLVGPTTEDARRRWELIKYYIKQAGANERELRASLRRKPNNRYDREELADEVRMRRAFMRRVPHGWNWRERLWTPDSGLPAILRNLEWLHGLKFDDGTREFMSGYLAERIETNWGFNPAVSRSVLKAMR